MADLGFTYVQGGRIEILFGDTWNADGMLLSADHDDAFGALDATAFPDGASVERALENGSSPVVTFDVDESGAPATLDPGHAMDPGKTPVTAFTTGTQEYGIFFLAKPRGCLTDADCGAQLSCDSGLGFAAARWDDPFGLTIPCIDGMLGCLIDTMSDAGLPIPGSGFCVDRDSSVATPDDAGRVASVAVRLRVGVRTSVRNQYTSIEWPTNRFFSPTSTTVRAFDPALPASIYDYRLARAEDAASGRVLLWGRPGFAGVNARGRSLHLYFAYANLPVADASGAFEWSLSYFTGVDPSSGAPQFSRDERDARALDLSGGSDDPAHEEHDLVQQMSIRYLEPLGWVMFYGGGVTTLATVPFPCGVLGLFAGADCADVEIGVGAIHVRFASNPWGPWSAPQDILIVLSIRRRLEPAGSTRDLRNPDPMLRRARLCSEAYRSSRDVDRCPGRGMLRSRAERRRPCLVDDAVARVCSRRHHERVARTRRRGHLGSAPPRHPAAIDCEDHAPVRLNLASPFDWCALDFVPSSRMNGPQGELAPDTIVAGRYRIRRLLGRGGMGVVYEAEHTSLGRTVALKMLVGDAGTDEASVQRFFQEARAAAAIGHPGIVDVLDLSQPNEPPFLVMEKLEGEELTSFLQRCHPVDPRALVHIAIELCDAVGAAHRNGIVHRDLKPDNVFLARRGERQEVKVLDFGIAKLAQSAELQLTQTGYVMGTPAYMAPEQMRGGTVDARADVYALGSILFQCFAGRLPFVAQSMPELVLKLATEPAPLLRYVRPDTPEQIEALVAACLEKDASHRPPDANAMGAALRAILSGQTVTPFPMTAVGTSSAVLGAPAVVPEKKSVVPLLLGCALALVALIVLGSGAVGLLLYDRDEPQPRANQHARPSQPVARPPAEPIRVEPEHVLYGRKLSEIGCSCIMRHSQPVWHSEIAYRYWVNETTGPTGRERSIDGVFAISEAAGCVEAVRVSNALPPADPELEQAATRFSQAVSALAPTLASAARYYEHHLYEQDGMQRGRELHPVMMQQYAAFHEADDALRALVERIEVRTRAARIAELARDPSLRHEYLIERFQEQAFEVMQLARTFTIGESDHLLHCADPEGFQTAVRALRARAEEIAAHQGGQGSRWGSYPGAADAMTRKAEECARRMRGTPFSANDRYWMSFGWTTIEGSPSGLRAEYDNNLLQNYYYYPYYYPDFRPR